VKDRLHFFFVVLFWLSMDPSKILIWNVRDLNRKSKRDVVRSVVSSSQPDIVCLQETKKAAISRRMVMSTLGAHFDDFWVLPASGTRGGILLAWKGSVCRVLHSRINTFSVSVQFEQSEGPPWWFTGVYGPQLDNLKIHFLKELREVRAACVGPWAVGGDFNLIYKMEDKNNSNVHRAMMGRFRRFLNDLELREVELLGRKFTWSNEREAPTLVQLDRVFTTMDWEGLFPDCLLQSSASLISDHCPLLLGLHDLTQGKSHFHFESFWTRSGLPVGGTQEEKMEPVWGSLQRLADKFMRLSRDLQSWSQKRIGHINHQIQLARELLQQLEIAQDSKLFSTGLVAQEVKGACSGPFFAGKNHC
jgi:exonuclease III